MIYIIDVAFEKSGHVHEAQCECGAGEGPHGHCKHIRAVLFACCKFMSSGTVNVEQSCTEKLQSFHKASKHLGSPIAAKNLNMPGADEVCNLKNFDPRPEKFRKTENYEHYFYNTCLNFRGVSKMPIFQLFKQANTRAVALDHDYLKLSPEDQFLQAINVTNISEKIIFQTEFRTRGQNKNNQWFEERQKRIHSSNFYRLCVAREDTDLNKIAHSFLLAKIFSNDAVKHGLKYEKHAISRYEQNFNCKVQRCGIFVSETHPFWAASPDGIISEELLCEVKCPFSAKNKTMSSETVPYLKEIDGKLQLSTKHKYYFQVQGQLFCSRRKFCDFIVYTITDIVYLRIKRDEEFISFMIDKLQSFFEKSFKPALLEKLFYKTDLN